MSKQDIKYIVFTIIVFATLVFAGAVAGATVMSSRQYDRGFNDGYDKGVERGKYYASHDVDDEYLRGLHDGINASEQTLYATCEDELTASQYPAGFCEGVSEYLNI